MLRPTLLELMKAQELTLVAELDILSARLAELRTWKSEETDYEYDRETDQRAASASTSSPPQPVSVDVRDWNHILLTDEHPLAQIDRLAKVILNLCPDRITEGKTACDIAIDIIKERYAITETLPAPCEKAMTERDHMQQAVLEEEGY